MYLHLLRYVTHGIRDVWGSRHSLAQFLGALKFTSLCCGAVLQVHSTASR